jgi:ATP-binding cassette, subfamily B, bacterial
MNQEIITRYIGQPSRLPSDLRARIEREWGGRPVQLYALADLDHALRFSESWLALGTDQIALARSITDGVWDIQSVNRARICAVRESPGLSANTLMLLGAPGDPPLAVVRYTQRQRGAFENLRFVLDEALAGRAVGGVSADESDRIYADAVARPIRDAQALVSGRESRVIFRLLGYLEPYRRQLAFGLSAAAVITLVSLVPPYIAGYLIDRVVRPAQDGRLARDTAATMAWIAVSAMAGLYLIRQAAAHVRLRFMAVLGE